MEPVSNFEPNEKPTLEEVLNSFETWYSRS